jgi:hypothetical protein
MEMIDIESKRKELLSIIEARPSEGVKVDRNEEAGEIVLEGEDFKLVLKITSAWIGYKFSLKKHVLGVEMSSWADTDNYALDFDPKVTEDTYQETKNFVTNLVENKVYFGKLHGRPVLAWPEGKGEYHVSYAPKLHFFTKEDLIPTQDIVSDGSLTKLNVT